MILETLAEFLVYYLFTVFFLSHLRFEGLRTAARTMASIVLPAVVISKLFFVGNSFHSRADFVIRSMLGTNDFHFIFLVLAVVTYFLTKIRWPGSNPLKAVALNGIMFVAYLGVLYALVMTQGIRDDFFFSITNSVNRNYKEEAMDDRRFIAHSTGYPEHIWYTNSLEGLELSKASGFKRYEIDINPTSDGKFVGVHDWEEWSYAVRYQGSIPPSLADFQNHRLWDRFTVLDMNKIKEWFAANPNTILVTDKVNSPIEFYKEFGHSSQLQMELFDEATALKARQNGIDVLLSWMALEAMDPHDTIHKLQEMKIDKVSMSRLQIEGRKRFLTTAKAAGIKVYLYNIHDEEKAFCKEMDYAYGMYVGLWNLKNPTAYCL